MDFSVNTVAASMTIPTKQNNENRDLLICLADNHLLISPVVEIFPLVLLFLLLGDYISTITYKAHEVMEVNEFGVVIRETTTYSEMSEKHKKGVTISSVYEICDNFDKTSRKSIAKCFSVGIVHKFRLSYKVNLREII